MSTERRIELIKCARDFDALIIADDVYDFLQWHADPNNASTDALAKASFPRLVDIDRYLDGGAQRDGADGFGNTMSNGSFSKICGPGLRVGWCEGSPKFAYGVGQTGSSCSGGAPSQMASTFVDQLLRSGELQSHINYVLRKAYAQRYKTLVDAVEKQLCPLGATLPQRNRDVVGGYFVWFTLPETISAEELAQRCQEEANVFIAPGSIFEVPGDDTVTFKHSIRLTFSWLELDEMEEGVRRIRTVLESMLKGEKAKTKARSQKGLGQIK